MMPEAIVECHSGYTYADRPRAFLWDGLRRVVEGIVSEARTPEGRRFVVRTIDGEAFALVYLDREDMWEIQEH